MYRSRVFIGGGSPTTLRYYTVMPPNNYIPRIFPGYNRIFTSFGKLHPNLFCLLGPLQPIGPRLAHRHSVNKIPFAASEALTLRRLPLLVFDFAICALVFAVGALVFARSLKPFDCSACRAGRRPCRCIQIARGPSVDGRRWRSQQRRRGEKGRKKG